MKTTLFFLFFLLGVLPFPAHAAEDAVLSFANDLYVVDGDSLNIGNLDVRILCIDAVELKQTCRDAKGDDYNCGEKARLALEEVIGTQAVKCLGEMSDQYKRPLVNCRAGDSDLARAMVEKGWAVTDCEHLKRGEEEAREAKRGIWRGKFQKPYFWRKAHPRTDDATACKEEVKDSAPGTTQEHP